MFLKKRKAFTMIELVFVIVVIGILSAIAIPKFAATRDDAVISKGKAEVAALRSAIAMERQKRILRGNFDNLTGSDVVTILEYDLSDKWARSGDTFTFTAPDGTTCAFTVRNNKLTKGACSISAMHDL